jgi:arylsulfatase A-like enzyme/lysophospholipase L1-like esterase
MRMIRLIFPLLMLLPLSAQSTSPPNILFIFSDDHALKAISAYGGPLKDIAPTPNLDRIANEGALFRNAFCANSICGPSRACILTGKHSHRNGYLSNDFDTFDGNQRTLPKILQASGYQTAVIGKWHLISQPQGFDHWCILPGQGSYYNPEFIEAKSYNKVAGYCTDIITEKSLAWLKSSRDPSKPFFLMCQHKAPHRNWSPALRHARLFADIKIPEPDTLFDDYSNRSSSLKKQEMSIEKDLSWASDLKLPHGHSFPKHFTDLGPNKEYERMSDEQKREWDAAYDPENQAFVAAMKSGKLETKDITRWKYQRYLKDYLRSIRAVDESVGQLLDYLKTSGLDKNTIVIYSSDQGFYLGDHGWYDKRWMFEESLAMPFMIRWPGVVKPGSRPEALIQNIDFAPTFLEMAGQKATPDMHGKSFVASLKDEKQSHHDSIYYAYYGENTHQVARHDGVRSKEHKLIRFPTTDEWNLFDLKKDPNEMKSVHADPAYAAIFAQMKLSYESQRKGFGVNPSTVPEMRLTTAWWKKRHQEILKKVKAIQKGTSPQPSIVFLGDSITQAWQGAGKNAFAKHFGTEQTLNLGFSGDQTQHVLWRLYNGEYDALKPAFVSLMIGTNNTGGGQDPKETAQGIRSIIDFIRDRSPDTKILLHSIFPRGAKTDDPLRVANAEINELIKPLADDASIFWLDMAPKFLKADGTLEKSVMPDLLHLNAASYDIWADSLATALQGMGWKKSSPVPSK